ncbi:MFS transporter [Candidatus Marithrix sp. Canyon 246]|uniref:MFS transporter n=1 Tax=Candidatus Marithrix sp. Canyon 246 TaxID=1827136 RepID=UPI000849FD7B|nr:MFS transporter [Candidatus Marithrix sp. Canyon 246]
MSQFQLLKTRRFLPLFITQFLGAFNDNVYKNALVILIIFQGSSLYGIDTNIIVTLSAGIFILPYFLFSATAGQLADCYEKSQLIRRVKILEIVIMSLAIIAFYYQNILMLIVLLFLMGTQSTLFGPLKYSILPQHLATEELTAANGLISMGTFLAILLGTILGGILISLTNGALIIGCLVIILAILGFVSSRYIPTAVSTEKIKINWNIATETVKIMRYALEDRSVFIAIIAISWFWFIGATYLSQVPAYSKYILGSNNEVVTLLLTMFSVGIGLGSMLCARLSNGRIELGLVPVGAIGIIIFSIDIYFSSLHFIALSLPEAQMNAIQFLDIAGSWRVLLDLVLIGLFGGFYIVPLNAMVQKRSHPNRRARVIAANNILNALFMVISALSTVAVLQIGFTIADIFLSLGILTVIISAILFKWLK